MGKKIEMIGKRFGRLVVTEECEERTKGGKIKYKCQCDCGKCAIVFGSSLRSGNTRSCGCLRIEKNKSIDRSGENHPSWKGGKVKRICEICGKEFEVYPNAIEKGNGRFCSKECAGVYKSENFVGENHPNWKGGKTKCICEMCGEEFEVFPYVIERGGGRFCSIKCRGVYTSENLVGENASNWKGGKVKRVCEYCGEEFEVDQCVIENGGGKFCSRECYENYNIGENHCAWKGGISPVVQLYRASAQYTDWRTSCMARDDFTCQICGKRGVYLNVHHIKKVSDIFKEHNIQTREDWRNCSELWNLDNGITLCVDCHKEIHFGKNQLNDVSNSANTDSFPVSADRPSIV